MASNSRFSYIFVAISFVSTALLYVYFKNKVDKVDEKLDMMYQLIQSHAIENDSRNGDMVHNGMMGGDNQMYQMQDSDNVEEETSNKLIEVSENEAEDGSDESGDSDDDSEDSEDSEDSDNDSEQLVLGENTELGEVKKIELNLEQDSEPEVDEEISLKKLSEVDLEDVSDDLNENDSIDLQVSQEKEESDSEDDIEVTEVKQEVKETIDYSKLKVVDLKAICRDKQLTNYAALKKSELIELLISSEQN